MPFRPWIRMPASRMTSRARKTGDRGEGHEGIPAGLSLRAARRGRAGAGAGRPPRPMPVILCKANAHMPSRRPRTIHPADHPSGVGRPGRSGPCSRWTSTFLPPPIPNRSTQSVGDALAAQRGDRAGRVNARRAHLGTRERDMAAPTAVLAVGQPPQGADIDTVSRLLDHAGDRRQGSRPESTRDRFPKIGQAEKHRPHSRQSS